jgi:hypothetical protein
MYVLDSVIKIVRSKKTVYLNWIRTTMRKTQKTTTDLLQ